MFFFHSLHPKRENIDHNLSKLLQGVLGIYHIIQKVPFYLGTHHPSTASPGSRNQLTDWRAFRARISLSSQMTLSLWTRAAICCSISNLKETKGKEKFLPFEAKELTSRENRRCPGRKGSLAPLTPYLCPSKDSLPKLMQELINVGPQWTDRRLSFESRLVRVLVVLVNTESLLR